jgi:hypothetical protein
MTDSTVEENLGNVLKSKSSDAICCVACYKQVGGKRVHCCNNYGCGSFFGCQGCFQSSDPGKPYKACQSYTAIARSIVQLIIVAFSLLSIMEFGNMMDASSFPGSNIQLDRYDQGNNTDLLWDSFKDGYFLEVVDQGRHDENASECSNFITPSDLPTPYKQLCKGTANATQEWKTGWVSAYSCDRSAEDLLSSDNTCLGWSGNVSMFGMLTFYMLAAYVFLFALATWIEQNDGNLYKDKYTLGDRLSCWKAKKRPHGENTRGWCCMNIGERNITWITLLWSAGGILLAVLAAGNWVSMCDKIDTGLGRKMKIVDPETENIVIPNGYACASVGCESSFASIFMWYALTISWMLLPQVFMFYFPTIVPASTRSATQSVNTTTKDIEDGSNDGSKSNKYYDVGHLKM